MPHHTAGLNCGVSGALAPGIGAPHRHLPNKTKHHTSAHSLCVACFTPWASLFTAANSRFISVLFLNLFAFDYDSGLKGKRHTLSSSLFSFLDGITQLIYSGIIFSIMAYVLLLLYRLMF